MISLWKSLMGASAVLIIGAAPVALADEGQQGAQQLQQVQQKQMAAPVQQKQVQQLQQKQLTEPQQKQVQAVKKAVALIVKVPKDASGKEMPQQAQMKLRVSQMIQQGAQQKDVESIFEEETIDVTDFDQLADEGEDTEVAEGDVNMEPWRGGFRGGFGFRRGFGFGGFGRGFHGGFGFRRPFFGAGFGAFRFGVPIVYPVPAFNYYYYPYAGFYPYW